MLLLPRIIWYRAILTWLLVPWYSAVEKATAVFCRAIEPAKGLLRAQEQWFPCPVCQDRTDPIGLVRSAPAQSDLSIPCRAFRCGKGKGCGSSFDCCPCPLLGLNCPLPRPPVSLHPAFFPPSPPRTTLLVANSLPQAPAICSSGAEAQCWLVLAFPRVLYLSQLLGSTLWHICDGHYQGSM